MHGLRMGGNGMTQAEYNALCITADARAVEKSKKRGEVMEKRIAVPDGMLRATWNAMEEHMQAHKFVGCEPGSMCSITVGLEAALRWLSENPIVPTLEQTESMRHLFHITDKPLSVYQNVAVEWQRRMFLAPEPEVPEEIKDLLANPLPTADNPCAVMETKNVNERILEAYRRGKAAK